MVIGISGKIGSGKDTVAKIIQYLTYKDKYPTSKITVQEILNYSGTRFKDYRINGDLCDWEIKKFAGKLKQIVSLLTGIPIGDLEKEEVKNKFLGEEWRRWYFVDNNNDIRLPINFYGIYSTEEEAKKLLLDNKINHLRIESEVLTPRFLLQTIGTEGLRNLIHPNVHINALFSDYQDQVLVDRFISDKTKPVYDEQDGSFINYEKKREYEKGFPKWLITDLRFPNEGDAIKIRNGLRFRVVRSNWMPNPGDTVQVKVFSNWSTITYTHYKDGNYYGVGSDGYKYKSTKIRKYNEHPSETGLDDCEDWDEVIDNDGSIEDLVEKVRVILKRRDIIK